MALKPRQYQYYQNDAVVDKDPYRAAAAFQGDRDAGAVVEMAREQLVNVGQSISEMRQSMLSGFGIDPEVTVRSNDTAETPALKTLEAAQADVAKAVIQEAETIVEAAAVVQEAEAITREAAIDGNSIEAIRSRIEAIKTEDTTQAPDYTKVLEEMNA